MANSGYEGFTSAFIMIILVLLLAFLIPAVYVNLESPETSNFQQNNGSVTTVRGDLQSEITRVDSPNNTVDMIIYYEDNATTLSGMAEGETRSVTFDSATIVVTIGKIVSDKTVVTTYDYPLYIGWPKGAKVIIENVALFIAVLSLLLMALLFMVMFSFSIED